MKDGYRYEDGKVFVTDYSNGNERKIEIRHYQDNIDEILITENVLEKLNSEYRMVNEIYEEDLNKMENLKSTIGAAFACVGMVTLFVGGLISLLSSSWLPLFLIFAILLGVVYKFSIINIIEEIKELKKTLNGYDFTIESMEKEIEKQMKKLKELEDNITREKIDNDNEDKNRIQRGEYIQLDYVGRLKELREYLSACYAVGCLQDYLPNSMNDFVNGNTKELSKDFVNFEKVKVLRKKFDDRMEDR